MPTANRSGQCALILEDEPVGPDSRLYWDSFPESIEESYNLYDYRRLDGNRTSQPIFQTYQGGNWGPFALELTFEAGVGSGARPVAPPADPGNVADTDLQQILIEMQRKVDWCLALGMPLERRNREADRIQARQRGGGPVAGLLGLAQRASAGIRRNDPPFVLIVFGSWKTIRARPQSITPTYLPPFHAVTARPYNARVRIVFQPIMPEYPTWETIRNQAGENGFQAGTTDLTVASSQAASRDQAATTERQRANAAASDQLRTQGRIVPVGN